MGPEEARAAATLATLGLKGCSRGWSRSSRRGFRDACRVGRGRGPRGLLGRLQGQWVTGATHIKERNYSDRRCLLGDGKGGAGACINQY